MANPSVGFTSNQVFRAQTSALKKYQESNSLIIVATSLVGRRSGTVAKYKLITLKKFLQLAAVEEGGRNVNVRYAVPVNSRHYATLPYLSFRNGEIADSRDTGGSGMPTGVTKPIQNRRNHGFGVNQPLALDKPAIALKTAIENLFDQSRKKEAERQLELQREAAAALAPDDSNVGRSRTDEPFQPKPERNVPPTRRSPPRREPDNGPSDSDDMSRTSQSQEENEAEDNTAEATQDDTSTDDAGEAEIDSSDDEDLDYTGSDDTPAPDRPQTFFPTQIDRGDLINDQITIPKGQKSGKVEAVVKIANPDTIIKYQINSKFDPLTGLVAFSGADAKILVNGKQIGNSVHFSHDPLNYGDAQPQDLDVGIGERLKKGDNIVTFQFDLETADALYDQKIQVSASRDVEYTIPPPGTKPPGVDPGVVPPPDCVDCDQPPDDETTTGKLTTNGYKILAGALTALIIGGYLGLRATSGSDDVQSLRRAVSEKWRRFG